MNTKIFPRPDLRIKKQTAKPPVEVVDATGAHIGRILGVLTAMCVWGLLVVLIMVYGKNSPDILAAFVVGAVIPLIFSIPFLSK